jgi:alginate production protein
MGRAAAVVLLLVLWPVLQAGPAEAQTATGRPAWAAELASELSRRVPGLSFGGELEVDSSFATNLDLDSATDDDLSLVEPQFALWLSLNRTYAGAFLELELAREWALDEPADAEAEERRATLDPKEIYLWLRPFGDERLSALVGRQKFKDKREWFFDEELDGVRLRSRLGQFEIEASASREELFTKDLLADREEGERVNNWLLVATYEPAEEVRLSAYTLVRDDRDRLESPIYFGLSSGGEPVERFAYWLELAHVRGREDSTNIRGWGFDVGGTYEFALPLKPALTLAYAFGSGDDDPDDDTQRSFRQTGLEDNEAKVSGVNDFLYYGEFLQPTLRNIRIVTGGLGVRPTGQMSVEVVYHHYSQDHASDELDSSLEAEPSGRSRRLGDEIDLILGYRPMKNLELTLSGGYFLPGRAFPGADRGLGARVELEYKF